MLAYRYHPAFYAAWKAVKEGLIGEPLLITAQKSYKLGTRHPVYMHRTTYGGTIPWVAIHGIDWIHWYSGGKITEVSASQTTTGNKGHGEMESSGACFFRLANAGCASLTFDYFRPDSALSHGDDRVRIAGEKGVVEVIGGEAGIITQDAAPRRLEKEEPVSMFQEFIRHIEEGTPLRITASEAFIVSEIALRCREAADTRAAIVLAAAS
jgi:predicted dehydrogenase